MLVLVLRVGIAETGGITFTRLSSPSFEGFGELSKEAGKKMVGIVTVAVCPLASGLIQKIAPGNLETQALEMAIARSAYPEISRGLFLEICWEGIEQYAEFCQIEDGWYAFKMVGFFSDGEEGYYSESGEVVLGSFPACFIGNKIVAGGIDEPEAQNKIIPI